MPASATRRAIDAVGLSAMLSLCVLWGAQQVAIKLAAPDVVPTMQVTIRSGIGAVLVGLVVAWQRRAARLVLRQAQDERRGEARREVTSLARTWRPGLLAGALFATEFLFIAEGLRRTSASHMAVFLYTAPVFTALGLHLLLPAERLRARQWAGVLLAFGGIALAFTGDSTPEATLLTAAGDLLGVLAGAAWGATTVVVRASALSEAPPSETLLYQLVCGFVLSLAYALLAGQAGRVVLTPVAWASILYQGVVIAFASYLTWFWLLRRYLASRLAVFSFMTPIFGVTFGVLVLHDPIGLRFAAGAAMVLAGITVVSGSHLLRRR